MEQLEEIRFGQPMPLRLDDDPRWRSVLSILSSDSFAKSARLSGFLSYVTERTLLGKEDEITEQQIGVHVFGRPTDYNPGEDNIVRQTARQLRQRLALYYQEEGRDAAIQVLIPRGGYIAEFQISGSSRIEEAITAEGQESIFPAKDAVAAARHYDIASPTAPEVAISASVMEAPAPYQRASARLLPGRWLSLCLGISLGAICMIVAHLVWLRHEHPPNTSDRLWQTLFRKDRKTMVVVGDAGLNMYSNLARRKVDIENYAQQNYLHTPEAASPPGVTWAAFAARRYIALSDLAFVTQVMRLPEEGSKRMDLRFARDIHFSDLENSNAILIGGPNYNPWVSAFDKRVDMQMTYDGERNTLTVVNHTPKAGELATYTWSQTDPDQTGYALVSLTDNIQSTGRVLLIQGTTMGGVETATDFLFNPALMDPIMERARIGDSELSNFDLLLETTFYPGGSLRAKIVALHIHAPTHSDPASPPR